MRILVLCLILAPCNACTCVRNAFASVQHRIRQSQERELKNDLFTLRTSIDQYTLDKQKAPQSLTDLVTGGYIKFLPRDPITNSSETWAVEQEDTLMSIDRTAPGIVDVHSGSSNTSTEGTAYNTW